MAGSGSTARKPRRRRSHAAGGLAFGASLALGLGPRVAVSGAAPPSATGGAPPASGAALPLRVEPIVPRSGDDRLVHPVESGTSVVPAGGRGAVVSPGPTAEVGPGGGGVEAPSEQGPVSEVAGAAAPLPLPPAGAERDYFARPYGLVEFGVGVLALPDARLCGGGAGCDRGDISLEVEAWPLFRASPSFAIGAGMTLALIPMQDVPRRDTTFAREHARRYFMAEGVGRYYFLHGPGVELWTGISAGLIVVSDNFRTRSREPGVTIIGSDSANIATEGLSLGLASGVTFGVNRHLQVGASLRFANWYLPHDPEVIAFGESASLSSRVTMLSLALVVAYHTH